MQSVSLSGHWQFRPAHDDDGWRDGTVPGGVYSDLLAADAIDDPYDADNELALQWVGRTDWVYRRTVALDDDFLAEDCVRLRCAGLDTVATVTVNGDVVGETANMHREFEFDVADALEPGENELEIRFDSPVEYSTRAADAAPYEVPTLRYPVDQPGRNHIRKAQCHYGWDWGPCLPTVGIWRDVELLAYSDPRIRYTKTAQDHDGAGDAVRLDVTVGVHAPGETTATLSASVAGATTTAEREFAAGDHETVLSLTVEDPARWWPNGYGDQPLYDLTVSVAPAGERASDSASAAADGGVDADADALAGHATTTRVGFRDLELVRDPDPPDDVPGDESPGESFVFEVNGVPVYAKGANWIPADALHGRVTPERYESLLDDAVAANMNMLRVWGGGYYERDAFYEACDERGVLVWQDFMFSCALYPGDDDFLASVAAEVRDQVRRLESHPSLALWCGNNEVEMGLESWFSDADALDRLHEDYETLFYDVIGGTVRTEDPTRTYWPGSPSSGTGMQDPYQEAKGDVHYWNVWHEGADFADYESVRPRFVSEFGYQSFPSVDLLRDVVPDDQLNPTAPLMEHHQRNPGGNERILQRMADHFRMPFDFADFVYLSQVQQALAMQTAIEHWRRLKPYCMGTLYWQLNDLWPCASWSSLEYGGDWKLLHHVARRIYAPVLVSTTQTDDGVEVWVTSDDTDDVSGTVTVTAHRVAGGVVGETTATVTVDALDSACVLTVPRDELAPGRDDDAVFLRATFDAADTAPAYEFFAPYKRLPLADPGVDATVDGDAVTLTCDAPALFVSLDAPLDGRFTDNAFHLLPDAPRTVRFETDAAVDADAVAAALRDDLTVTHLEATY